MLIPNILTTLRKRFRPNKLDILEKLLIKRIKESKESIVKDFITELFYETKYYPLKHIVYNTKKVHMQAYMYMWHEYLIETNNDDYIEFTVYYDDNAFRVYSIINNKHWAYNNINDFIERHIKDDIDWNIKIDKCMFILM